jgi:hypothetical protein
LQYIQCLNFTQTVDCHDITSLAVQGSYEINHIKQEGIRAVPVAGEEMGINLGMSGSALSEISLQRYQFKASLWHHLSYNIKYKVVQI